MEPSSFTRECFRVDRFLEQRVPEAIGLADVDRFEQTELGRFAQRVPQGPRRRAT
jgi:hypothetical protein